MDAYVNPVARYLLAQSWQVALLAAIVALISFALRNRSAHIRYLLWLIVLSKCLIPPLYSVPVAVLPERSLVAPLTLPALPEMHTGNSATTETGKFVEIEGVFEPIKSRPAVPNTKEIIVLLWSVGAFLFLLWVGSRAVRYTLWLRSRKMPLPPALHHVLQEFFTSLKLKKLPRIWLTQDIGQPFVWGLFRGSVYLPVDFVNLDEPQHCRTILAHELSHVVRLDACVNLLQVVAQAIYWFHPLVWWVNRRIRIEREKCCDEMAVVNLSAPPEQYTGAIVEALATERRAARHIPSLAIVGSVRDIEERIKTMLKPGKKFYKSPSLVAITIAMLLALLIVPMALVLTARAGTKPSTQKWVQTSRLYGGSVFSFAVSGRNLFAGTKGSGVFISTDNGTSWKATGLPNTYVRALVVNGTSLFAGTEGDGVFLSTDNGTSWTAVNNGLTDLYVLAVAVSSNGTDGMTLFAGTNRGGGMFRSTNNGASWTAVNNGLTGRKVISLALSPNGAGATSLFAATSDGGVFRSTDNGTSWTTVNNGLTDTFVRSLAVSGADLFAGTNNNGVFRSTDNGASWTAVNNGLTFDQVHSLLVSGTDLFAGTGEGGGVFRSTDNGTSWTEVNNGLLPSPGVRALAVSGTNLFAGTNGSGVFRSTNNGTSWTAVNTGLTNTSVYSFAAIPNGAGGTNLFAGTAFGGVFRLTNDGTSWTVVNSGLNNDVVYDFALSGTNLFAATSTGGVFRSTDNGTSWTAVNNGLDTFSSRLAVIGTNLFAGTWRSGVFLSTNNGTSWTAVNNGLTNTRVWALVVSGANLFAGTLGGGVFRSTDNGAHWSAVNNGLTNTNVVALVVSETNLFAGTGGGVFRSADNGTSWTAVNNGLMNTDVMTLAVSGTNLFAGTAKGVFVSTNNGTSWTAINDDLTNTRIHALMVSGTSLFAGAEGHGVCMLPDAIR